MRAADVRDLFDFNDWANESILRACSTIRKEDLNAPPTFTYRNLLGTLLHTLDVEWSWRILLQRSHPELWDTSLSEDDYPDVATIAGRWSAERDEMRAWLDRLTDDDLARVVDLDNADRFPLWYYLLHIVSHGEQQRRDAQLLLRSFGVEPPDLEFLYFADTFPGAPAKRS